MDLILRAVAFLSALFTLGLTIAVAFSLRRERPLRLWPLAVSGAVSLVTVPLYVILSGARLTVWVSAPVLLLGLAAGALRGFTTRVAHRGAEVLARESLLLALVWGGSAVAAQVLTLLGSSLLASLGLIPLFFSAATQAGLSGSLFLRRLFAKPRSA